MPLPVRGKYDAAQTTEDNRRHSAMADGLSAAAANSRKVRRTLRNRARYEVANNSYAKGAIATLTNDEFGLRPIIEVAAGADEASRRIEWPLGNWAIEFEGRRGSLKSGCQKPLTARHSIAGEQ